MPDFCMFYFDKSVVLRYELVICVKERALKTLGADLGDAVGNKAIVSAFAVDKIISAVGRNNKGH